MLLLIDNYDSFTFNLAQYLGELGAQVAVRRNDEITIAGIAEMAPSALVMSPGPSTPDNAGICLELAAWAADQRVPLLGICLGHQAIGQAFGGKVVRCHEIVHGKTGRIHHRDSTLLAELPSPFDATRYHSLVLDRDRVPEDFSVVAWNDDRIIMGLQHRTLPIFGLQFHPESIATEHGHGILEVFLKLAGAGT